MTDDFVRVRQPRWERLEALLAQGARRPAEFSELAALYRVVSSDLASARAEGVPADVRAYLDDLAGRAHHQVYVGRRDPWSTWWAELWVGFPRAVRRNLALFALASALFYGSGGVAGVSSYLSPAAAEAILGSHGVAEVEGMYASPELVREGQGDMTMAGFYVYNNVGIALRCMATGALAGLGPIFYLSSNGVTLGAVAGDLARVGSWPNLVSFVIGHAPWELTGVVVAATAGLRLGLALVVPGSRSRTRSTEEAAPDLVRLVLGAMAMLLVAAAIEGFWSASGVGWPLRIAFAAVQTGLVTAWLTLGGRG